MRVKGNARVHSVYPLDLFNDLIGVAHVAVDIHDQDVGVYAEDAVPDLVLETCHDRDDDDDGHHADGDARRRISRW